MQHKYYQDDKADLPFTAPKKHHWYKKEDFKPWRIHEDPGFFALTPKEKFVYFSLCRRSSLTKSGSGRRYAQVSTLTLAKDASFCERTVRRAVKKILHSRLAIRWHKGTTSTGPSRYELPASIAQIIYWRINYKSKKEKK